MKILKEIDAKLTLLKYLQHDKRVDKDVIGATTTWIGKELSDALSGQLANDLLVEFRAKRARLEKKDFRAEDEVWFTTDDERQRATVVAVKGNSLQLDFQKDFHVDSSACTSTELEKLMELMTACTTVRRDTRE
jgi:hypothetical protein